MEFLLLCDEYKFDGYGDIFIDTIHGRVTNEFEMWKWLTMPKLT